MSINTFDVRPVLGGVEIRYGYWTGRKGRENFLPVILLVADGVLRAYTSIREGFAESLNRYGEPQEPVDFEEVTKDLPELVLRSDHANLMQVVVGPIGATATFHWIDPSYLLPGKDVGAQIQAIPIMQLIMTPEIMVWFVRRFMEVASEVIAMVPDTYPYLKQDH